MGSVCPQMVKQSIEFLEEEIDKYEGVKFIVNHHPLYFAGEFGYNIDYGYYLERFLDQH